MTPSDLLTQIGAAIATQTSGNSAELPSRELSGEEVERIWNDVDSIFVRATRQAVAPSWRANELTHDDEKSGGEVLTHRVLATGASPSPRD